MPDLVFSKIWVEPLTMISISLAENKDLIEIPLILQPLLENFPNVISE